MSEAKGRKCVFFDRDGIVNESPGPGYVERWADFKLLPEFVDVLREVSERGYVAIVVTNQRGVARGIMSLQDVEEIHLNLRQALQRGYGLTLLDVFCCTHDKDECECRKPKPGMLMEAARRHGLDLASSWMVGDNETDVEAGRRAGCRTVLVGPSGVSSVADFQVPTLTALNSLIEKLF